MSFETRSSEQRSRSSRLPVIAGVLIGLAALVPVTWRLRQRSPAECRAIVKAFEQEQNEDMLLCSACSRLAQVPPALPGIRIERGPVIEVQGAAVSIDGQKVVDFAELTQPDDWNTLRDAFGDKLKTIKQADTFFTGHPRRRVVNFTASPDTLGNVVANVLTAAAGAGFEEVHFLYEEDFPKPPHSLINEWVVSLLLEPKPGSEDAKIFLSRWAPLVRDVTPSCSATHMAAEHFRLTITEESEWAGVAWTHEHCACVADLDLLRTLYGRFRTRPWTRTYVGGVAHIGLVDEPRIKLAGRWEDLVVPLMQRLRETSGTVLFDGPGPY